MLLIYFMADFPYEKYQLTGRQFKKYMQDLIKQINSAREAEDEFGFTKREQIKNLLDSTYTEICQRIKDYNDSGGDPNASHYDAADRKARFVQHKASLEALYTQEGLNPPSLHEMDLMAFKSGTEQLVQGVDFINHYRHKKKHHTRS